MLGELRIFARVWWHDIAAVLGFILLIIAVQVLTGCTDEPRPPSPATVAAERSDERAAAVTRAALLQADADQAAQRAAIAKATADELRRQQAVAVLEAKQADTDHRIADAEAAYHRAADLAERAAAADLAAATTTAVAEASASAAERAEAAAAKARTDEENAAKLAAEQAVKDREAEDQAAQRRWLGLAVLACGIVAILARVLLSGSPLTEPMASRLTLASGGVGSFLALVWLIFPWLPFLGGAISITLLIATGIALLIVAGIAVRALLNCRTVAELLHSHAGFLARAETDAQVEMARVVLQRNAVLAGVGHLMDRLALTPMPVPPVVTLSAADHPPIPIQPPQTTPTSPPDIPGCITVSIPQGTPPN